MGGEESGVTARTQNIILESAYFMPTGIRRTSRELGLSSDASYRFERGVDPGGVLAASRRAEELLLQICGGESRGVSQAGDAHGGEGRELTLRLARVRQVLGAEISGEQVETILTGFGLKKTGGNDTAKPIGAFPRSAPDLAREIDLIEEVARVYGLDADSGPGAGSFRPVVADGSRLRFPDDPAPTVGGHGLRGGAERFAGARPTRRRAGSRSRTRSRRTARSCAARCCRACWRRRDATCGRVRRTCGCSRSGGCSRRTSPPVNQNRGRSAWC